MFEFAMKQKINYEITEFRALELAFFLGKDKYFKI